MSILRKDCLMPDENIAVPWKRLASAVFLALASELIQLKYEGHIAALGPALAAILLSGLGVYKNCWAALRNRSLDMNVLMSLAVTGALFIGEWPEAAMIMALFNLAEAIEEMSLARARRGIENILKLAPDKASVKQPDGAWLEVEAGEVEPGALARLAPGERAALDGEILSGSGFLNQAPVTGESMPVEKGPGDKIFAGSINESGSIEYRVTVPFSDSTLSRIIRAVEEARSARAPIQRFMDKFAALYTPAVFLAALAAALLPPLFLGGDWFGWLYRALTLLVIACPCALVISIPVTIAGGLAAGARRGLLIKGGAFLEEGRKLSAIAFDKTGVLTLGRPAQTDVRFWRGDQGESLARAAALASRSNHPVSRAVYEAALKELSGAIPDAENFQSLSGLGVRGRIGGGEFMLGNKRMLEGLSSLAPEAAELVGQWEGEGKSVALLCGPEGLLAIFAVRDEVRESSLAAVANLKKMGLFSIMLSGDNQNAAARVGAALGIDEARGGLLPEDKLREIGRLKAGGFTVGMVGDGINDAPALASADIGFAMGAAGTDAAIESADVAVMDDDPGKIADFIKLSRAAHVILRQNIVLALGMKSVFLILALMGVTNMWMAVFADIGVSLMAVFNGLRMLGK